LAGAGWMKPYYQDDAVTIYHGDALEVLPSLDPQSVTLLWTDPPYGHSNHEGDFNARLNEHRGIEGQPIANDDPEGMRRIVDAVLTEAMPALNDDCCCCCCCCCGGGGPRPTFAWLAQRMDESGLSFFHSVIWDKVNPGLGWRYRRQHEMVMVAHKTKGKLSWSEKAQPGSNVFRTSPPRKRDHPNEKPLKLVEWFIKNHTEVGETVLDPFMGSGTTLRAAKNLGRKAIGIELEERFCEVAAQRMGQEVLDLGSAA
jgi:site-specific DNA-methyltransferase (adenine-specific)